MHKEFLLAAEGFTKFIEKKNFSCSRIFIPKVVSQLIEMKEKVSEKALVKR